MQVHEIGFLGGDEGKFLLSGGCPQGSGCEYTTPEFRDSLVGQPHRPVII
jgi:hypothetical protein